MIPTIPALPSIVFERQRPLAAGVLLCIVMIAVIAFIAHRARVSRTALDSAIERHLATAAVDILEIHGARRMAQRDVAGEKHAKERATLIRDHAVRARSQADSLVSEAREDPADADVWRIAYAARHSEAILLRGIVALQDSALKFADHRAVTLDTALTVALEHITVSDSLLKQVARADQRACRLIGVLPCPGMRAVAAVAVGAGFVVSALLRR